MNEHLSSASLKSLAKGQLLGKYGIVVAAYAIHMGCILFTSFMVSMFIDTTTLIGNIIYLLVNILLSLFGGLFVYGEAYIYLKIACNQPVTVNDLFCGFGSNAEKIARVQIVFALVAVICSFPNLMTPMLLQHPENPYLMLIYVILMIVTTAANVIFSLTFAASFYLMHDFPNYTPKEILMQSYKIMKGNRGRLFYIELSFIPLLLLGFCSCCVTYLWILPYMEAVQANFYLDLIKKRNRNS